ncbi:MAG: UDP-N-acetylmuramoyl-tripeptide--D-alanyl-D-alanine ligase [Rickettsiales bacterium]|nr:UDP-N-acetylmuramoyl-tripeptide--D-alanyl-D-alanine ligase [Rickettsiales bacterium]
MHIIIANIQFIILAIFLAFKLRRTLVLCHLYQQEEYLNSRFLRLVFKDFRFIDRKFTIGSITTFLIYNYYPANLIVMPIYAAFIIILISRQFNPIKHAKKPLVLTKRIRAIIFVCLILNITLSVTFTQLFGIKYHFLLYIILIQLLPISLALSNLILAPNENFIQKRFYNEAKAILARNKPVIIAITGSYGKTSTKYILQHILSSTVQSLATPGSVNTVMGIVRIIREKLKPEHKYFIVEMGAYGLGSIDRLCRLSSPDHGIITAIGVAHLERYKLAENVAKAKFELSNYVDQAKGYLAINCDQISEGYIASYNKVSADKCLYVSQFDMKKTGDFQITNARNTIEGIKFDLVIEKEQYSIAAPIYGLQQVDNIALSFALAMKIGLDPDLIIASLCKLPQVKHRLEVKKEGKNIIIDDAYNSNPAGFKAALDVVEMFGANNKDARRIVVTPGMVEMGDKHYLEHKKLGKLIALKCDILIAILPERIESLISSFQQNAPDKIVMRFANFKIAKEWLDSNAQANDILLFENDLPDLYETKIKF